MTIDPQARYLSFGDFRLDCRSGELKRHNREVRLQPQPAKLLMFLLARPGEVVTREEIQRALWGEDTFVDFEHGINFSVKQIRQALGDDAEKPRYIETVPRVGYRFLGRTERFSSDPAQDPSPYPGLKSFSSSDAAFFFGREVEIDLVRRKLESRKILALMGPSGSGKSSFLKAGLLPSLPESYRVVLFTLGSSPHRAFARALVSELSGDAEAMVDLMEDVVAAASRWRKRSEGALVVIDAFEELFTLNPPEVQGEFASVVGRLAVEAGVQILLSMRDDFLFRCHDHEALAEVFTDLTPLGPLKGPALHRALVEPALSCGYRFETDELVDEMLREVEGERGALPLLAFAAAQLWEKRDREKKMLTRTAFEENGRVGGALGRHAEATIEKIGAPRLPLVRELFRNLVTGQGTRASREVLELLSVFPKQDERRAAEEVLQELVAARLLTSYETSVEIIHESLLSAWPRLVRWQTQDADGAQLRDQLRQAAQLWQERGRRDDLLWTGSSYRELSLWRERYPGGLSETEEAFTKAATKLAGRRRRRRRIAAGSLLTAAVLVAAGSFVLFRRASDEALRAEASALLALAQLELEVHPSAALAYAIKSLELADSSDARRFALRVLQNAPTQTALATAEDGAEAHQLAFSPNGEHLAVGGYRKAQLVRRTDGKGLPLSTDYPSVGLEVVFVAFGRDEELLVTNLYGDVRFWSVLDGREVRKPQAGEKGPSSLFTRGDRVLTSTTAGTQEIVRSWPISGRPSELIGTTDPLRYVDVDADGLHLAYAIDQRIYIRSLDEWNSVRRIAEHASRVNGVAFHPMGDRLAAADATDEIRIWPTSDETEQPLRVLKAEGTSTRIIRYSPSGKWLAASSRDRDGRASLRLWDMKGPRGVKPIVLESDRRYLNDVAFDPDDRWVVTAEASQLAFWPLGESYPHVLEGHDELTGSVAFTPDGKALVSASRDHTLRVWPLHGREHEEPRVLLRAPMTFPGVAIDPTGQHVVVSASNGRLFLVSLGGEPERELEGFSEKTEIVAVAFSPNGGLVAAAPYQGPTEEKGIRIWNLESDHARFIPLHPDAGEGFQGGLFRLVFLREDEIAAAGTDGFFTFNLRDGFVRKGPARNATGLAVSLTRNLGFLPGGNANGEVIAFDLDGGSPRAYVAFGPAYNVAIDPTERVLATAGRDGVVRIGPVSGGEPHLFFGHKGPVRTVAFSPDGRWLASAGEDRLIRLWPVPDVSRAPPHARPREEFLANLRSWTNLRVLPNPDSPNGWQIEVGTFPGWAHVPIW